MAVVMIPCLLILIKEKENSDKQKISLFIVTIFCVVGTFFLFLGGMKSGMLDKIVQGFNSI